MANINKALTWIYDEHGETEDRKNAFDVICELRDSLREMHDSACTNATSTPSKAAFLKARAILGL